jgi:hypothetical protein
MVSVTTHQLSKPNRLGAVCVVISMTALPHQEIDAFLSGKESSLAGPCLQRAYLGFCWVWILISALLYFHRSLTYITNEFHLQANQIRSS